MMSDANACDTAWSPSEADVVVEPDPELAEPLAVAVEDPVVPAGVVPAVEVAASPPGWLPPSSW